MSFVKRCGKNHRVKEIALHKTDNKSLFFHKSIFGFAKIKLFINDKFLQVLWWLRFDLQLSVIDETRPATLQESYLISCSVVYAHRMVDLWEDKKQQTVPRNISALHSELNRFESPSQILLKIQVFSDAMSFALASSCGGCEDTALLRNVGDNLPVATA